MSPGYAETITGFLSRSWIKRSPCVWLPVTHVFFPLPVTGSPPASLVHPQPHCNMCPCQPGCPPLHTPHPTGPSMQTTAAIGPIASSENGLKAPPLLESSHLRPHHACVPSPVCSESLHAFLHYFHVKSFRARGMGFRANLPAGFPRHLPGKGWGSAWLSDMSKITQD